MPGPIIQKPQLPSWADPKQANENDPLYQTLLRKAVGVLGLDDPTSSIMGAATAGPLGAFGKSPIPQGWGGSFGIPVGQTRKTYEKAATTIIDELLNLGKQLDEGRGIKSFTMPARTILGNVQKDPVITTAAANRVFSNTNPGVKMLKTIPTMADDELDSLIQHLADAYMPYKLE